MGLAGTYTATYVFDTSAAAPQWSTLTWPSAGVFPVLDFEAQTPWSVSLNPELFRIPDSDKVTVTMKKKGGGTYNFKNGSADFYVNTDYNYSGDCIIFRPNVSAYLDGDVYTVTVSGIEQLKTPAVYRYDPLCQWSAFKGTPQEKQRLIDENEIYSDVKIDDTGIYLITMLTPPIFEPKDYTYTVKFFK